MVHTYGSKLCKDITIHRAGHTPEHPCQQFTRIFVDLLNPSFFILPSQSPANKNTMPSSNGEWPDWPELTPETGELDPENVKIKKDIAATYGEAALRKSWIAVCDKLKDLTNDITTKGTSVIPELAYDDVFKLSDIEKQRLRDVGCFVVRGLVPEETANGWFEDLNNYVKENKGAIGGNFKISSYSL